MDAKPQRPLRALKIARDENVPPQLANGKSIHQRNKSTPALSTLMQVGGLKAAAKRTAFADVSNTARLQPAKDDLALSGKSTHYDVLKDPAIVSAKDVSKSSTTLLRPAQRPLAALALKDNQVSSVASAKSVGSENSVDAPNVRKTLAKKSTTIFKDTVAIVEEVSSSITAQSARVIASTAPVHQALQSRREINQPEANSVSSDSKALPVIPETTHESKRDMPLSALSEQPLMSEPSQPDMERTEGRRSDAESRQSVDPREHYEVATSEARESYEYLDSLEQQARVLERERNEELARESHALPISEPEEYWEEDDEEEEYYEADGYTTARSIRSRGDNTTGGVTVVLAPRITARVERELAAAKDYVDSMRTPEDIEDDAWDTSMVAEYGDEIFEYMRTLEERMRPNPHYMDNQAEIQWSMRSVLMDWLVQVHLRFTLLPETLFLAVNYVDRFLSCKVVSLGKLQLVGATAIFVAAKYEEINCPSVQEIVYMVDGGYTVDEILKAERFMLSMLQFELGWPGPMSFLRRISKADDYDLETRTLAKYFLEITVMDERFVGCTPSFTAAGAHCLARIMLKKGDWSPAHVHYSGYTFSQLRHLLAVMLECCENPQKHHGAVYEKYAEKRYKRASLFVEAEMQKGFQLPPMSRESLPGYPQSWRRK